MITGVNKLDGPSNEKVLESYGLKEGNTGCGVAERTKNYITLKWYDHVQRMNNRLVKYIYGSQVSGVTGNGRPPMV